jgi:hydroxylysine kinase
VAPWRRRSVSLMPTPSNGPHNRPVSVNGTRAVVDALASAYGLAGSLTTIATEKDDTYKLTTEHGCYLVKVAADDETAEDVDLQISAMQYLERTAPEQPVQRVVGALDGATFVPVMAPGGAGPRSLRVLKFVDGPLMAELTPTPELLECVGRAHARMTMALTGFSHPQQDRHVVWDLQAFSSMRPLADELFTRCDALLATAVFDRFDHDVLPLLDTLERQVVHGDVSPFNVVIESGPSAEVAGFIDFGDITRSAVIFDLSVPLANQLSADTADPWQRAYSYLTGFLAERKVSDRELALIAATAPARLLLRALLSALRGSGDPARHDYLLSHGHQDWRNLEAAWSVSAGHVTSRLRSATPDVNWSDT